MESEAAWKGALRWRMPPPSLAILCPRSAHASPSCAACTTTAPQPSPNRMQVPAADVFECVGACHTVSTGFTEMAPHHLPSLVPLLSRCCLGVYRR